MRATTLIGVVMIAASTAAISQVATAPAENKTAPSIEEGNVANTAADTSPSSNRTTATTDDAPLDTATGDPAAASSAPPK